MKGSDLCSWGTQGNELLFNLGQSRKDSRGEALEEKFEWEFARSEGIYAKGSGFKSHHCQGVRYSAFVSFLCELITPTH